MQSNRRLMKINVAFIQLYNFSKPRARQEECHNYRPIPELSERTSIRFDNSQEPATFILGQCTDLTHSDFWKGDVCSGIIPQQPCTMSILEKRAYGCQGPCTSGGTVWFLMTDF
jgi:hypothetical protein